MSLKPTLIHFVKRAIRFVTFLIIANVLTHYLLISNALQFSGIVKYSLISFITLGKSTLSLVSFAKYEWFEEWKDDKVNNRAPEYKELKQIFIDSILEVLMDIFPKITRDKVFFMNLSLLYILWRFIANGILCRLSLSLVQYALLQFVCIKYFT